MARNRFENYISNGYQSQFVPTPLDTNMMFNVLKERQGYYDNLVATNANLMPQFNYIKPSDYDMGHQREAIEIQNMYTNRSSEINDLLKNDNLEGAKNLMLKTIHDKDLKRKIQYLESAYAQDMENVKSLSDIKKLDDRNLASQYYYKNRLSGRSFEDFLAGKSAGVNNPLLSENPGLEEMINRAGNAIQANGYTLSDGSVIVSAKDAQGNPTGKYMYKTGDVTSEIDFNRAMDILSTNILSNPEVISYIQAREAWGSPILNYDEKGKPIGGPLMGMIASEAAARAHRKSQSRAHYMTDDIYMHGVRNPNTSMMEGSPARPAARNKHHTIGKERNLKIKDGKIYAPKVYGADSGQRAAALSGGMGLSPSTLGLEDDWIEIDSKKINDFGVDLVKVIDPKTNQARVVRKDSELATQDGAKVAPLTQEELLNAYVGFQNSMQNVSWNTTAPLDTKSKWNRDQLMAQGNSSAQIRVIGEDGTIKYETNKMADVDPETVFYDGGVTLNHPEKGSGYRVFYGTNSKGEQVEVVTNTRISNNKAWNDIDEINKHLLSTTDFGTKAFEVVPGLFAVQDKEFILDENQDKSYVTSQVPTGKIYMVPAKTAGEALNNYKKSPFQKIKSGDYIEQMTNNILNKED